MHYITLVLENLALSSSNNEDLIYCLKVIISDRVNHFRLNHDLIDIDKRDGIMRWRCPRTTMENGRYMQNLILIGRDLLFQVKQSTTTLFYSLLQSTLDLFLALKIGRYCLSFSLYIFEACINMDIEIIR